MIKKINRLFNRIMGRHPKSLQEQFPQYEIGRGSYSSNLRVLRQKDGATLKIGAFCSIADGVEIFLGGEHRIDWVTTYPFNVKWESARHIKGHPKTKGNVEIGNDVWIGRGALIFSGVKIADGAVIGARAVVTNDVPPYAIVTGNPAKIVKKRFDEEIIVRLLNLKWWHWEDARICRALPMMLNNDIHFFLEAAERNEI